MSARPRLQGHAPLIVAGVAAVAAGILLTGLWILRGGGGTQPGAVPPPSAEVVPGGRPGAAGGLIGGFAERVADRLSARAPVTRPLSGLLAVTLSDVVWREPDGAEFGRAERAAGRLELDALRRGDIVLRSATLDRPVVSLRQRDDRWNYEVVLRRLLRSDGAPPRRGRVTVVHALTVSDGTVHVAMPARTFTLEDVDALLRRVAFTGPTVPDPVIDAAWATAILVQPVEGRRLSLRAEDATARVLEEAVAFDIARLTVEGARLADVRGVWQPDLPVYGVEAEGRAVAVELAEMQQFFADRVPPAGTASFRWAIEALTDDAIQVRLEELQLESLGTRASGSVALRVDAAAVAVREANLRVDPLTTELLAVFVDSLPFEGTLVGTLTGAGGELAFDGTAALRAAGEREPFTTRVSGTIALTDAGYVLRGVTAELDAVPLAALRAFVPSLPFGGALSGTLELTGPSTRAPLQVDLRLVLAAGTATLGGTVDLTGAVPVFDLQGRLTGVDLQRLLLPAAPPVLLTAEFDLRGRGSTAAAAQAEIRVRGGFDGWQAEPGDTLIIVARVDSGTMMVDTLAGRLATLSASANGRWRFVEPLAGVVRYAANVTSLAPWGPYLPLIGDTVAAGTLALSGSISGSLDRPRVEGDVRGERVRAGEWAARSLEASYTVVWAPASPQGDVTIAAQGLETPTAGEYETVNVRLQLVRPQFSLVLAAQGPEHGVVEVEATGSIPATGPRDLIVQRARADLSGDHWMLASPAAFHWGDEGFVVENLDARQEGGTGMLRLDGRLLPRDQADFRIETADFPVGSIQELLGSRPVVTGRLWTTARLRAAGGAPVVSLAFRLEGGAIEGVPLTRFEGNVDYLAQQLSVRAVAALSAEGGFDLSLELPARLDAGAQRVLALIDSGAVSGSLTATAVSIAPLQSLLPQLQDLAGRLDGRIALEGTVAAPSFQGRLVLTGGAVRVPALGQEFPEVAGQIVLEGRRVTIPDLHARSDGLMTVTGTITFEDLTSPVADLVFDLERFRPADVAGLEDAAVYGRLAAAGPWDALVMSGAVRIEDGNIPIPEFGGAPADIFAEPLALDLPGSRAPGASLLSGLTIRDLSVSVGNDVWFSAQAARAQLGGEVTLSGSAESLIIQGTLTGQRGTYTLQAGPIVRRFEIVSAEIRFLGSPEPNPAIDITARRIVFDPGGRQLEVEVRIGGTLRTPTLNLASADAPAFPQSELLSVLFFGRPTLELAGGGVAGEAVLEGTFLELATLELEELLIQDLGFAVDLFQVRFGPGGLGGFGAPTFVLGWEIGSDVFLTAESGIAALLDTETSSLNTWALRLEWAFDRNSRLRTSYEPVTPSRFIRGLGVTLPLTRRQQFSIDLRRRWTY